MKNKLEGKQFIYKKTGKRWKATGRVLSGKIELEEDEPISMIPLVTLFYKSEIEPYNGD